ncbi:MAG: T9SS type A sorting domain-containing protein [Gemmatimonadetes bacterium]|nr:T9SS type A sorting domain-containing protein [Gemmatimonadota bacterium]
MIRCLQTAGCAVFLLLGGNSTETAAMGARPPYVVLPAAPEEATAGVPAPSETVWLQQNDPNPVSGTTIIRLELPVRIPAVLTVFDIAGRRVKTLMDGPADAGEHSVSWDRRDFTGEPVPPGIYFYRLEAAGIDETRKMVVLR